MTNINRNFILLAFSILIYISYFFGFYFSENSIGSGGYDGDLVWIWNNFQLFKKNNLIEAINHPDFFGNRTPLLYVLNKVFNPFLENLDKYRLSIFLFSLLGPYIFYLCLKEKFKNSKKEELILISSLLLLSPFYRTTAIWGMEINYGIISMLGSIYFWLKINTKKQNSFVNIFNLVFFSSLTVYFDQKLLFVPILSLLKIFLVKKEFNIKIISILLYLLFSLPFLYFIIQWKGIVPSATIIANPEASNSIGNFNLDFYNLAYATTMMGLYLLPLIVFFQNFSSSNYIKFLKLNFWKFLSIFIIYMSIFIYFDWFNISQSKLPTYHNQTYGLGFINKFSYIFFDNIFYRKIFLVFSFLFFWIVVYSFFNNNFINFFIIIFFYFISLLLTPLMQEYFDPYIFVVAILYFEMNFNINFKNILYLMFYNLALLLGAIIYYL